MGCREKFRLTLPRGVYRHSDDVIMGVMASQITSLAIIYSTFFRSQIKENTKAPRHWPLWGEFTGDRWIPRTNVSIWWRHHGFETPRCPCVITNLQELCCVITVTWNYSASRDRRHSCSMGNFGWWPRSGIMYSLLIDLASRGLTLHWPSFIFKMNAKGMSQGPIVMRTPPLMSILHTYLREYLMYVERYGGQSIIKVCLWIWFNSEVNKQCSSLLQQLQLIQPTFVAWNTEFKNLWSEVTHSYAAF